MRKWLTLLSGCLCLYFSAFGQAKDIPLPQNTPHAVKKAIRWFQTDNDSSYIEDHTRDITFRLFGSRKYNYYDIVDRKRNKEVLYRPNTPFNLGFGLNYKFVGINLAFNLPFINKEDKYGKTRGLDLQSHFYARKLVIDLYAQFYNGYYISRSKGILNGLNPLTQDAKVPIRPDIHNLTLGLGVQYIFNDRKFSYRAAYLQNDYQKKSAGSFLVGAELFGVRMRGDSSIIPGNLARDDFFDNQRFTRTGIVSLAASAGYAYTFVYKRHFFVTLSLTGSIGTNYSSLSLTRGDKIGKFGLQLNNTERISIGYNSKRYFAGIHYMNFTTRSNSPVPDTYQRIGAGDFRISVARRFKLKKKLF